MKIVMRRPIKDKGKQRSRKINFDDSPAPTIQAYGIGGVSHSQYDLERAMQNKKKKRNKKPVYKVMTMSELRSVPWNGYNVISTFSGCGGSCLGFKMAGYKVLWASEFIPAAENVYRLNHPNVILDTRDIRKVTPEDILKAISMKKGEVDVLEGSPPCASFSTAGKKEKKWGQVTKYSETKQRVDDLFFELARIIEGIQPKVFVAENVSGLVKGVAKGYFKMIMSRLKEAGYNVKAKLLDAQWLGVPQARQRLIFMGVRNDLRLEPVYPKPLPYNYTISEALPWINTLIVGDPRHHKNPGCGFERGQRIDAKRKPCRTINTGSIGSNATHHVEAKVRVIHDTSGLYSQGDVTNKPSPTIDTNPRLFIEQESSIKGFAIEKEWERLKPGKKGRYLNLVRPRKDKPCPTITQIGGHGGTAAVTHPTERRKFSIAELKRICGFPDDFQLTGSYAQQWERLGRAVPPVMMYHVAKTIKEQILDRLG